MNTIPTLDLRRFKTDPEGFVQEMGAAYQAWGFAGIAGHGIDSSVAINALRAAEKVFALPDATKKAYFKNNGGTRGYTPFGTEIAKKAKKSKINVIVFDRNGRQYAQRLSALADAARKEGLEF